jgi:hypothetical protein
MKGSQEVKGKTAKRVVVSGLGGSKGEDHVVGLREEKEVDYTAQGYRTGEKCR